MRRLVRSSLAAGAAGALVLTGLAVTPAAQAAPSPDLVISQVYGGGGNAGASLRSDFLEIFNRGTATVSVTGWSVQYGAAASTSWAVTALSGSIAPGRYYLVKEATGTGGTTDLPPADATGTIAMSATAGKVALVPNSTALSCGTTCAGSPGVVDLVGFGTANDAEGGAPVTGLGNAVAGLRNADGCTDTDNNAANVTPGSPTPRNSASPTHVCGAVVDTPPTVTATSPADGATGVDPAAGLGVTFDEPVATTGDWLTLGCTTSGEHAVAVSGGPLVWSGDPTTDLALNESCTAVVHAAQVSDLDGTPDHPTADRSWSFSTAGAATAIHDIQGAAHRSPLTGTKVTGVAGIVTATTTNGFWEQDPAADADPATSEAVFVFTSRAPTVHVGDAVHVAGTVTEFRPGGATTVNLTTTEIGSPTVTLISSGNPLPAAVVIGAAGRTPPDQVVEDDTADVETGGTFDPASDGIDFWESLEGMRIELDDAVATGPTSSFGEVSVAGDDGAYVTPRTARGGVVISANDLNPGRILTDDAIVPAPQVDVGDHFSGPLVGVVDYSFGTFKLVLTQAVTGVSHGLQRESTATAAADQLSAATFNVENLDPRDPQAKFDQLAGLIVHNMAAPDLISVEEVQDNTGATDDGVVDSTLTLQKLTAAISAAGGPAYEWRVIDPVNDQDGGEPGGNIRVVFLFRTDRGLAFVDRGSPSSTSPTTVVTGPDGSPQLSSSPGRIAPADAAWTSSRKPLAGEFTFRGRHLFAVANHFNSKGGDDPIFGRRQPAVRSSEVQRHQQATLVHDFVGDVLAVDPSADVVVMGDLNDFEFSDTLSILEGSTLHDLVETLPKAERYSYVFEGNSQVLDHVLVSDHLFAGPRDVDVVHVNAEFAQQASDHDPTVVRLTMNTAPAVAAGGPYEVDEGGTVGVTATSTDPEADAVSFAWDLDGDGAFDDATGPTATFDAGSVDGPATRSVSVLATDAFGATSTATATVDVRNVAPTLDSVTAGPHAGCGTASSLQVAWHDPAQADTFVVAIAWGDGQTSSLSAAGSALTASHVYAHAGAHTVSVSVRDDDGGVSGTTWSALVVDYTVADGGLLPPWKQGALSVHRGNTVPLKVELLDCDGRHPAGLAPTYDVRAAAGGPVLASGVLRPDGRRYEAKLDTARLPGRGTYTVTVTIPSTGQTVSGTLTVR